MLVIIIIIIIIIAGCEGLAVLLWNSVKASDKQAIRPVALASTVFWSLHCGGKWISRRIALARGCAPSSPSLSPSSIATAAAAATAAAVNWREAVSLKAIRSRRRRRRKRPYILLSSMISYGRHNARWLLAVIRPISDVVSCAAVWRSHPVMFV